MQNRETAIVFERERAAAYDQQAAKFAPLVEALHFLIRLVLSDLPADAQILYVGVGTRLFHHIEMRFLHGSNSWVNGTCVLVD